MEIKIDKSTPITIIWFRQDLRLRDNPALTFASSNGVVLPIYILDDKNSEDWMMGAASRWWLHHALNNLDQSLGRKLNFFQGDPTEVLLRLTEKYNVKNVVWSRCYEPWRIKRDVRIKAALTQIGIEVESFNASLLWEPWNILKKDGTPYKVFTPYYRRGCLSATEPRIPLNAPKSIQCAARTDCSMQLEQMRLLPGIKWYSGLEKRWDISEHDAITRLDDFISSNLENYSEGRNFPNKPNVSGLSPYLHFGQISPNTVWHRVASAGGFVRNEKSVDSFLSELGWREFSHYLLFHFPQLPHKNLQTRFNSFPWRSDSDEHLCSWKTGKTGYPLVDAGMRELYQTGYMHNRVRMVVGSFLVKNLLIHWHAGEEWFWDCLVDADLASNSASWQWIAGCGADAAPFFRVFNPVTQSEKFDPTGDYIRRYVPELSKLSSKYIHTPWLTPEPVLKSANVTIGKSYPAPIVDLKESRQLALQAFAMTKEPTIDK